MWCAAASLLNIGWRSHLENIILQHPETLINHMEKSQILRSLDTLNHVCCHFLKPSTCKFWRQSCFSTRWMTDRCWSGLGWRCRCQDVIMLGWGRAVCLIVRSSVKALTVSFESMHRLYKHCHKKGYKRLGPTRRQSLYRISSRHL